MKKVRVLIVFLLILLSGCTSLFIESNSTSHPSNACNILKENNDWLNATKQTYKKWSIPASIQLSFIKTESSFIFNARPIKREGFFFDDYYSSAFGFSQALDGTWLEYKQSTSNYNAKRTSFSDSVDFIGWYLNNVSKQSRIKKHDIYNLYLAYHEGISGWKRGSYKKKKWLVAKAKKIKSNTLLFSKQLRNCDI
jgi:hypothetical protein